ncbi:hypothetical protein KEM55_003426 [Ascosphaera atra]|nr:hypothetical protein KEM55_003426 [Ascosphaera atra]
MRPGIPESTICVQRFDDSREEEGEEGLEGSYGGDEAGHHQDASRALAEWKDMWASLGSG